MNVLDLIFPITCLNCNKPGRYLCNNCLAKVKKARQVCIECQKPSIDGFTHTKCKTPWAMDGVFSVWNYEGVIRKVILKLKYNFAYDTAKELAGAIIYYSKNEFMPFEKNTVLVPVPLHKKRENWRGFNQTEEVGKLLAGRLGWGFNSEVLIRKKKTAPQVELKSKQRKENVRGVFALNSNFRSLVVGHKSIVIFDDVLTTGATMKEAGKVLKRNGAQNVRGLTICS